MMKNYQIYLEMLKVNASCIVPLSLASNAYLTSKKDNILEDKTDIVINVIGDIDMERNILPRYTGDNMSLYSLSTGGFIALSTNSVNDDELQKSFLLQSHDGLLLGTKPKFFYRPKKAGTEYDKIKYQYVFEIVHRWFDKNKVSLIADRPSIKVLSGYFDKGVSINKNGMFLSWSSIFDHETHYTDNIKALFELHELLCVGTLMGENHRVYSVPIDSIDDMFMKRLAPELKDTELTFVVTDYSESAIKKALSEFYEV